MQSRQFGLGTVFFLYVYDPATQRLLHRFGSAAELVSLFHVESGATVLVRRAPEADCQNNWRCYVQEDEGSLISTGVVVSADSEAEALARYYEAMLLKILNQPLVSPAGKSFFLCEGEKGLLWLVDDNELNQLFRQHHPLLPDSFFTDEALSGWMAYGSLTREEYMVLLAELADQRPDLISAEQRVQIGLQIVKRDRETAGIESGMS